MISDQYIHDGRRTFRCCMFLQDHTVETVEGAKFDGEVGVV